MEDLFDWKISASHYVKVFEDTIKIYKVQTIKFNKLNLKEDDLLLDMGCGEGRHTIGAYIEKPVNSFGFDLSYQRPKSS